MAVDGEICRVKTFKRLCFIRLRSTFHHGSWSIPGQRLLVINDYTFKPRVGQIVWGDTGSVFIEPGMGIAERREYRRIGIIHLREGLLVESNEDRQKRLAAILANYPDQRKD